uniref:Uncharacterized protein n=1 Tax=viral metagenome TaxID=1070528 RepID=A0A6C0DBI6_9ZZZZ
MILIIRGHLRETFNNNDFYNLLKKIYETNNILKIYIHTWNIFSNNISWREINENKKEVTEKIMYEYFRELKDLIKHIIIDDDNKIELIGNLEGKIAGTKMPVLGWKNYWYSQFKIIDYIKSTNDLNSSELIVNLRFDVLNNSNSINQNWIIYFIKNNLDTCFYKNKFFIDDEILGLDNIYLGNINTMYKLIYNFNNNLDTIIKKYKTKHPEYLVYYENNCLTPK